MKKIVALAMSTVFVLACALVLLGCGADKKAETPAKGGESATASEPLQIVESGYSVLSPAKASFSTVVYGFVLKNPNTDKLAKLVEVKMTAKDAKGSVVGEGNAYAEAIAPGATLPVAGDFMLPDVKNIAKVEFAISMKDEFWVDGTTAVVPEIKVLSKKVKKLGEVSTASGKLKNTASEAAKDVHVDVILRNAAGKIVGGYSTLINAIEAGATVSYKVDYPTVKAASITVTARASLKW